MLKKIVEPLLDWYAENRRILPWREQVAPYRTWISEIMLQQTRVDTVIPYYERFMKRLPDVYALASVPDDELNKLWEGLGYYSRARNLKKAAVMIADKFAGKLPQGKEDLLKLPGIGEYTAGAIRSIAFGLPEPAVDGNVLRVLSRITGSERNISDQETKTFFAEKLKKIYPKDHASAFTQSLMELGALVCLPNGEPQCMLCPLKQLCAALCEGKIDTIPVKGPAKAREIRKMTVLILQNQGKTALKKRPKNGLLAGLYELPNLPGHLTAAQISALFPDAKIKKGPVHKAVFTHIEWHMNSFILENPQTESQYIWASEEDLQTVYSLPSAFKPFLKKIKL